MQNSRKKLPPQARLRELYSYCPETGDIRHRERVCETKQVNGWNAVFAGKIAGSLQVGRSGVTYRIIAVDNVPFMAHRIVWKWWYGVEPPEHLDHRDGNGDNNRISNLRAADSSINAKNKRRMRNNKSGVNGVSWSQRAGKWKVQIGHNGKIIHLGYFSELAAAKAQRLSAEKEYGYSPRHGRAC